MIHWKLQVTSDRQWYGDWIVDTFEPFLSRPLSQFSSRYCSVSAEGGGGGAKSTCAPISGVKLD